MSTLHELRATLEEHADGVHDGERFTRAAAVHQRVRGVRRRRTAAVAVAAVAVLAAVVTVGVRLGGPDDVVPAERWHGVDVPTEVELAAGSYELDRLRAVRPGREVEIPYPEAVERRAFALVATGLGDGSATLLAGDRPLIRLSGDRQLSAAYAYSPFTLQVRLDDAPPEARVGIAFYEGPGTDTVFPERHGTGELAASESSDTATAEVTVTAALSELEIAGVCPTIDGSITLWIDGAVADERDCSSAYRNEDGSFGVIAAGEDDEVEEHTIRVERTEPGVHLAAYVRGDGPEVLGQPVAETVEYAGRTWVLDELLDEDDPGLPLTAEIRTDDGERLIDFRNVGGYAELRLTSGLGEPCEAMGTSEIGDSCNPVLLAGDVHRIEVTGPEETQVVGLVYRLQDPPE